MNTESISDQLHERRLALGLSLAEVAHRVGTSSATLCRYEKGWSRFEINTLRKLAGALSCRLDVRLEPWASPTSVRPSRAALMRRIGRLFWDRPLRASDLEEYSAWVVRRVLEYGNLADVRALTVWLGRERLLREVAGMRFTSARTRNLWTQILEYEGNSDRRSSSR